MNKNIKTLINIWIKIIKNFIFKNKLIISNLNNYINLSKSYVNNYEVVNPKQIENKIESDHKSLANTKDKILNFENNKTYENI